MEKLQSVCVQVFVTHIELQELTWRGGNNNVMYCDMTEAELQKRLLSFNSVSKSNFHIFTPLETEANKITSNLQQVLKLQNLPVKSQKRLSFMAR